VRFGKKFARAQFGAAFILGFALPVVAVALAGASVWLLLPLMLIPEAWRQQRTLRTSRDPKGLISLLGASGRFLGLYALLLAIGLLLA